MERLLTPEETARLLGVKKATLYMWAYRRQIPSQKVNGVLRFCEEDLRKWLSGQSRGFSQSDVSTRANPDAVASEGG